MRTITKALHSPRRWPDWALTLLLAPALLLAGASQGLLADDGGVRASIVTGTAIGYRPSDTGYTVQNLGVLTLGAMHYDVMPELSLWAAYGAAFAAADSVGQVAAGGAEYRDVIDVTAFIGAELGQPIGRYAYYDPWFVGVGLTFRGLEFDLTDILEGESLNQ